MRDVRLVPIILFLILISLAALAQQPSSKNAEARQSGKNTEQNFASGGKVEMHLTAGDYEIAGTDASKIRVTYPADQGNQVNVSTETHDASAKLTVKARSSNNLHVRIELPKRTSVIVRLSAGDLNMKGLIGDKDVEMHAGDVQVDVGDPESYGQIDASVHTGDLNAQAFGVVKDGLFRSFKQERKGQYRLHAHVGAGDLHLYSAAQ